MKNMDHKQAAQMLWEAEQGRYQIDMLTQTHPEMTVEDAYAVQLENVRRREAAGERVVGMKIGLTSVGMQQLLHVHEPDYGHLFENMLLLEREPCLVSGLIQPKVEGELSFCLGKSLQGPGITVADVYDATEWVTPSIEIVDSRIKDWKIRLPDTIADNGSSARFMLVGSFTIAFVSFIPSELVNVLAGLAMLNVLIQAFNEGFGTLKYKTGAFFALCVGASGLSFLGIGSAFWALVAGVVVSAICDRKDFKTDSAVVEQAG